MAKNLNPKPKQIKNHDQKILKPDAYLETQRAHQKWYAANQMGRQAGKPRIAPVESKKKTGMAKHILAKHRRGR